MAQLNLALALFDQGDLPQCRSVIDEALAVRRQQRDRNNIAQAAASLALVALAEDRLSEAAALVGESISLRQELGEKIALAESYVIQSAILLEQGNAGLAEKAAHQAATTFHDAGAWGPEGEALLSVAAVQLALGDAANALANVDAADKVLAASKDAQLRLRGTITRARTFQALGRKNEAATILTQTLAESRRLGLPGLAFEVLLASLESNPTAARQLAPSAQQAGFLRIARKAR
jgi:tetratricopeptide (TPR) repeat protein